MVRSMARYLRSSAGAALLVALLATAPSLAIAQGRGDAQPRPLPPVMAPLPVEQGWYVAGGAGLSLIDGIDFVDPVLGRIELQPETGFSIGGVAGYRFSRAVRVEGEIAYNYVAIDRAVMGNTRLGVDGSFATIAGLANVLLDFGRGPFRPYIGAGLGFAVMEGVRLTIDNRSVGDGTGTGFAWQLIGGGAYQVAERVELLADYRYLQIGDIDTDSTVAGQGGKLRRHGNHQLRLGVRYSF